MVRELSRDDLERLIREFMEAQGMCVLATCGDGQPRASATEYFPAGTTIYILTEGGQKLANLERNQNVSVAIHTQFTGWNSIKGLQITGSAEIGGAGSEISREGEEAYRRRRAEPGAKLPGILKVIRIVPRKIEYLDTSLRAEGHGVKHTLDYPGPRC